ncbi:cyclase family protein [Candidatus Albibeggiatoa sp. nov. NOAA]|uniref:cyclase family protein n=1 Tax=Candidatus Albibeggiatoa sp. nov. NOAA TaxID=3162724 RepID=UPI0032F10197|nr:cyclase family protein [Thiotrichaceae bacterium]
MKRATLWMSLLSCLPLSVAAEIDFSDAYVVQEQNASDQVTLGGLRTSGAETEYQVNFEVVDNILIPKLDKIEAENPDSKKSLWHIYKLLQSKTWVDLTHAFDSDIPHWKGFEPMRTTILYNYADGFLVHEYCHVGQWGTHVDPPAHFHEGLRTQDQIDVKEMLMPLVVIDVHEKVAENPDYQLTMEDVQAWEAKHGDIPEGAFVAMRTDWAKRWPSQEEMQNVDDEGIAHYPGWSQETLTFLYETRKITASGHEPTDTDPGISTSQNDYSLESYILKQDKYQIELLANLDQVPEAGALVSVTWPNAKQGSGFPARVFAILP